MFNYIKNKKTAYPKSLISFSKKISFRNLTESKEIFKKYWKGNATKKKTKIMAWCIFLNALFVNYYSVGLYLCLMVISKCVSSSVSIRVSISWIKRYRLISTLHLVSHVNLCLQLLISQSMWRYRSCKKWHCLLHQLKQLNNLHWFWSRKN